jgi:hypothetical protein
MRLSSLVPAALVLAASTLAAHADTVTFSYDTPAGATIIQAASSTKNLSGKRDPEMHQTRKGAVVLRPEGAHRDRQQGGCGAFGLHLRGVGGGQGHAA